MYIVVVQHTVLSLEHRCPRVADVGPFLDELPVGIEALSARTTTKIITGDEGGGGRGAKGGVGADRVVGRVDATVMEVGVEVHVHRLAGGYQRGQRVGVAGEGAKQRGGGTRAVVDRDPVAAARVGARLAARLLARALEVEVCERQPDPVPISGRVNGQAAVDVIAVADAIRGATTCTGRGAVDILVALVVVDRPVGFGDPRPVAGAADPGVGEVVGEVPVDIEALKGDTFSISTGFLGPYVAGRCNRQRRKT